MFFQKVGDYIFLSVLERTTLLAEIMDQKTKGEETENKTNEFADLKGNLSSLFSLQVVNHYEFWPYMNAKPFERHNLLGYYTLSEVQEYRNHAAFALAPKVDVSNPILAKLANWRSNPLMDIIQARLYYFLAAGEFFNMTKLERRIVDTQQKMDEEVDEEEDDELSSTSQDPSSTQQELRKRKLSPCPDETRDKKRIHITEIENSKISSNKNDANSGIAKDTSLELSLTKCKPRFFPT